MQYLGRVMPFVFTISKVIRDVYLKPMTYKEALQRAMDSEEECTFSSEEGEDFEDERLDFEEHIDPSADTISNE